LALTNGHGRYMIVTPERTLASVGEFLFDQKSTIAVAMPIATAFKFCIGHRKMGS
jgi:hypothetical protein